METGAYDLLLPTEIMPNDKKDFAFSDPLIVSPISIIYLTDAADFAKDKSPTQKEIVAWLKGRSLGLLTSQNVSGTPLEDPLIAKQRSQSVLQLIDMLGSGRISAIVEDRNIIADTLIDKRPHLLGKLRFVDPAIFVKTLHVGFSKKNPNYPILLDQFNATLSRFKASPDYQRIIARYGYQQLSKDPKTIRIGTVNNPEMKIMRELSRQAVPALSGIKIDWLFMEENILRRRVLSSIAIGDPLFDVITVGAYDTLDYARRGWIKPFTNLTKEFDEKDLLEPVMKRLSYDRKIYALPFYGESSMTYYRKDVFRRHGLTMPAHPTFEQIKAFAKKIHDPKSGLYGICLRGKSGWGENISVISSIVHSLGGRWFDMDWKPEVDSRIWQEAMQYYVDILLKYGPPDIYKNGYVENLDLFIHGHCGIWVEGTVAATTVFDPKISSVAGVTGYTDGPRGRYAGGSRWFWSWALAIPYVSKSQDLALKFLTWATSKDYINLVGNMKGWLKVPPGTRASTYTNPLYQQAAPFGHFVLNLIQNLEPLPKIPPKPYEDFRYVEIPEFTAVGTAVSQYISQVLQGSISIDDGLRQANRDVYKIMYHAGYYDVKKVP